MISLSENSPASKESGILIIGICEDSFWELLQAIRPQKPITDNNDLSVFIPSFMLKL